MEKRLINIKVSGPINEERTFQTHEASMEYLEAILVEQRAKIALLKTECSKLRPDNYPAFNVKSGKLWSDSADYQAKALAELKPHKLNVEIIDLTNLIGDLI